MYQRTFPTVIPPLALTGLFTILLNCGATRTKDPESVPSSTPADSKAQESAPASAPGQAAETDKPGPVESSTSESSSAGSGDTKDHEKAAATVTSGASCTKGGCKLSCAANGNCEENCPGGRCDMLCEQGSTCTLGCAGGKCKTRCKSGRSQV